jgi:hypothetical protein
MKGPFHRPGVVGARLEVVCFWYSAKLPAFSKAGPSTWAGRREIPLVVVDADLVEVEDGRSCRSMTSMEAARSHGWVLAKPGVGVAAHLPGEEDVLGGDRHAVAPGEVGLELHGDGDALAAAGRSSNLARPLASVGSSAQSRQPSFQSLSKAVIGRLPKPRT